ncbi:hypothetical protein STEG23_028848 [Scotinomys teguina]
MLESQTVCDRFRILTMQPTGKFCRAKCKIESWFNRSYLKHQKPLKTYFTLHINQIQTKISQEKKVMGDYMVTIEWTAVPANSVSTQTKNHYQFLLSVTCSKHWALMYSDRLTQTCHFCLEDDEKKPHSAMGYDRYVAICNPLRYTVIMNKRVCAQLVWGSCSIGLLVAIIQIASVFRAPFCGREVAHYFCDIRPVMKLSCADTTLHDIVNFIISSLVIVVPMGLVFVSYILIISTILKIASAEGRKKAFATCASHLTVVIIHYGCASIAYLKPKSENTRDQDQLISVTYTVFTPLLNPVVYTLRNKEVKDAIYRAIGKKPLA